MIARKTQDIDLGCVLMEMSNKSILRSPEIFLILCNIDSASA